MNIWQRFLFKRASKLVRQVATLLINDPGGWDNHHGYWLKHPAVKVDIWMANRDYGLRLCVWPLKPGFPAEISPRWVERQLIWSLVRERREPSSDQIAREHAAEVLKARGLAA